MAPRTSPDDGGARWRTWLDGPPIALPRPLDEAAERWARASPRLRALVVLLTALAALALMTHRAARSPWGPPTPTVVVTTDLPLGWTLTAADVRAVEHPRDTLPASALLTPAEAVGERLARPATAGAVLTVADLAPEGPAAGLPPGQVAFPLHHGVALPVRPGQRVDLVAGDGAGAGVRLASGATVLAVDDEVTWLAVDRDDAPALAGAARWGELTAVLLPP